MSTWTKVAVLLTMLSSTPMWVLYQFWEIPDRPISLRPMLRHFGQAPNASLKRLAGNSGDRLLNTFKSNCTCIILENSHIQSNCNSRREGIPVTNATIYLQPKGRLGNVLFELAGAYALAKDTNTQLAVTPFQYSSDFEHMPSKTVTPSELTKQKLKKIVSWHKLKDYIEAFDSALSTSSFILSHYLQRYAYFGGCEDEIRSKFALKKTIIAKADQAIKNITLKHRKTSSSNTNITTVGIQIRRGDLIGGATYKDGYRIPPVSYFEKAMDFFKQKYSNVIFIICTNGQNWVEENLLRQGVYFSPLKTPAEDMALMSRCDHAIISFGTFSWWTGFYNLGTVIYYKDWLAPNSSYWKRLEYTEKERFPPYWIPMV